MMGHRKTSSHVTAFPGQSNLEKRPHRNHSRELSKLEETRSQTSNSFGSFLTDVSFNRKNIIVAFSFKANANG